MPIRPENFEPLLEPAADGSHDVLDSIQLDQVLATLASLLPAGDGYRIVVDQAELDVVSFRALVR